MYVYMYNVLVYQGFDMHNSITGNVQSRCLKYMYISIVMYTYIVLVQVQYSWCLKHIPVFSIW